MFNHNLGYPEAYAKGSQRLQDQVTSGPMPLTAAYRRGQNSTQHRAIRPQHSPSNNMKFRGFSIPIQNFQVPMGAFRSWLTPSGQRSTSQQRVTQPSLQYPTPQQPIGTRMPWNQ